MTNYQIDYCPDLFISLSSEMIDCIRIIHIAPEQHPGLWTPEAWTWFNSLLESCRLQNQVLLPLQYFSSAVFLERLTGFYLLPCWICADAKLHPLSEVGRADKWCWWFWRPCARRWHSNSSLLCFLFFCIVFYSATMIFFSIFWKYSWFKMSFQTC